MKLPARELLLASFALILAGCGATTQIIVRHIPEQGQKYRIAVMNFKDAPGYPGTGQIARDTLSTHILSVERYDVVDREAIDVLLKEQQFTTTGAIDQSQAIKIGKLLGVDAIMVGAVTEFRKRSFFREAIVAIDSRLISVQTGEVQWTARNRLGGSSTARKIFAYTYFYLYPFMPSATESQLIDKVTRTMCNSLHDAIQKKERKTGA